MSASQKNSSFPVTWFEVAQEFKAGLILYYVPRFKLSDKQVRELEDFSKGSSSWGEQRRAIAILNRHNGMTIKESAAALRVSRLAVYRWCKNYRDEGIYGLEGQAVWWGKGTSNKDEGKGAHPTDSQTGPTRIRIQQEKMVYEDIAGALNKEGIKISPRYVTQIMHEMGLTSKSTEPVIKNNDSQYHTNTTS